MREVAEETGIVIGSPAVPLSTCATGSSPTCTRSIRAGGTAMPAGVTRNTEHVFGLRVPRATPRCALDPREHLRHHWLPWREAADRCFSPSNAEAILQLPRVHRLQLRA